MKRTKTFTNLRSGGGLESVRRQVIVKDVAREYKLIYNFCIINYYRSDRNEISRKENKSFKKY